MRAGVGQSTCACTTWTHMLAVFAADRLSAAALSHRLVMTCNHARAHVRQSTPYMYQTGKGPCNRHVSTARGALLRFTLEHVRWDCTHIERDEHDPISRGAAEHATTHKAGPAHSKESAGRGGRYHISGRRKAGASAGGAGGAGRVCARSAQTYAAHRHESGSAGARGGTSR